MYVTEELNKAEATRLANLAISYGINDSYSDIKLIHAYAQLIDCILGDEEEPGRTPDSLVLINASLILPEISKLTGEHLFDTDIGNEGEITITLFMRWKAGIALWFNTDGSVTITKAVDRSSGYIRVHDIREVVNHQFLLDALAEYHIFDEAEPEDSKSQELSRYYKNCFIAALNNPEPQGSL